MESIRDNGKIFFLTFNLKEGRHFGCFVVQSMIINYILGVQKKDEGFQKWLSKVNTKELDIYSIDLNGALRCRGRLCVPNRDGLRKDILDVAYKSQMTIHP